jgi:hypothetical protein
MNFADKHFPGFIGQTLGPEGPDLWQSRENAIRAIEPLTFAFDAYSFPFTAAGLSQPSQLQFGK